MEADQGDYGVACHLMSFSKDQRYLMIYYQTVDNSQVRVNDTSGKLQIYDLEEEQFLKGTWEDVYDVPWTNFNFPNNLYGQFLPY